ncbi:hypothetical protein JXA88_08480, partial [Candidatus Fermentibacteria bacterium]|nr:hypothetical protein [Candidatus Fermentibacteria bacterium]
TLTGTAVLQRFKAGLDTTLRGKVQLCDGASSQQFVARERQVVYALTAITEALIDGGARAVEVSVEEAAFNAVVFRLRVKPMDSHITFGRPARLIAQAVIRSHGGSASMELDTLEPFVSLAFPHGKAT